jgi:serine O-acetyltransferase
MKKRTVDQTRSPWKADKARYPRRPWLREPSIWAIAVYRFGRWNDGRRPGPLRWLLERIYWVFFHLTEVLIGVSIPKSASVGPGLRIWHFGNIFVHPEVKIGANCVLRQGVTIGNRYVGGPVPILEEDVELGAYAQILGGVRVGRGAKIGAMSVVLDDVPPHATAVGIPARIIPNRKMDSALQLQVSVFPQHG